MNFTVPTVIIGSTLSLFSWLVLSPIIP